MALWRTSSLQQHIIIHPSYWNFCVSEQQSRKRSSSCQLCVTVPAISLEWWVQKYCDVSWWWNVNWFGWSRWRKRTLKPHFVIYSWWYYIVIWMSTLQLYTGCFLSLAGAATRIIFVVTKDVLLRQTHVCCDKSMLVTTFVTTKLHLLWQIFIATNTCWSRQKFCCNKRIFVASTL